MSVRQGRLQLSARRSPPKSSAGEPAPRARLAAPRRAARPLVDQRPRRGTPEGTRERLVAAGAEVLNRDGYFRTDSNAIARAAGYSPATFYKHFVDKRQMLLAAYERWVVTEWEEIAAVLRAEGRPTRPRQRTGTSGQAPGTENSTGAVRIAERLTAWIVAHHRRWRGLRASVLALVGSDAIVRDFYLTQRRRQLELLREMRKSRPAQPADREADALLLFSFERTCDALAAGEAEVLGLRPAHVVSLLARALAARLAAG